jgi:hypothetical protein
MLSAGKIAPKRRQGECRRYRNEAVLPVENLSHERSAKKRPDVSHERHQHDPPLAHGRSLSTLLQRPMAIKFGLRAVSRLPQVRSQPPQGYAYAAFIGGIDRRQKRFWAGIVH